MPYTLQSKQVSVSGETLMVYQASNLMEIKRSLMITEADAQWNGKDVKEIESQAKRYLETLLYPSLLSCTEGNLPTLEEFVHRVPASDSDAWMAAARELNPRWFPNLAERTPEEQQADLEKKES
jgi:hypothetical protein